MNEVIEKLTVLILTPSDNVPSWQAFLVGFLINLPFTLLALFLFGYTLALGVKYGLQ